MSKGILQDQREGKFDQLTDRDKEIQGSIWSLIFLVSEQALAFRMLRNRLQEKGVLDAEDEALINQGSIDPDKLQAAYAHVENAFNTKYDRARYALDHPEEVTTEMEQRERDRRGYESTSKGEVQLDPPRKNSLTAVTGTISVSPDGEAEIPT